eukprot:TRINITY_DN20751_c0_g1_i1.p1 TRINITY_DN20751_c0_g1~~TRINITY_DN20751_c0_g1_i1.p1  ORF type:complete len:680 (+),score=150.05 TRINITY_DN20751_c0_g1_i1:109-2148(+)
MATAALANAEPGTPTMPERVATASPLPVAARIPSLPPSPPPVKPVGKRRPSPQLRAAARAAAVTEDEESAPPSEATGSEALPSAAETSDLVTRADPWCPETSDAPADGERRLTPGRMPSKMREEVLAARRQAEPARWELRPSVGTWLVPLIPRRRRFTDAQEVPADVDEVALNEEHGRVKHAPLTRARSSLSSSTYAPCSCSYSQGTIDIDRLELSIDMIEGCEGEIAGSEKIDDRPRDNSSQNVSVQHLGKASTGNSGSPVLLPVCKRDIRNFNFADETDPAALEALFDRFGLSPRKRSEKVQSSSPGCCSFRLLNDLIVGELTMRNPFVGSPRAAVRTRRACAEPAGRGTLLHDPAIRRLESYAVADIQELTRAVSMTSLASSNASVHRWFTPEETIIFFDWDDTLCPTNWIQTDKRVDWKTRCPAFDDASLLLEPSSSATGEASPCRSRITMAEALRQHEAAVIALLRVAAAAGHVVIVTLAQVGWLETSIENFMPGVAPVLRELGVEVIYARKAVPVRRIKAALADQRDPWAVMKEGAMRKALKRFYSRRPKQSWKNCLSIGDSQVEAEALAELTFTRVQLNDKGEQRPVRCKTVKFVEDPSLEQLTQEVELMASCFSMLVHYDGDVAHDLKTLDDDAFLAVHELLMQTPAAAGRLGGSPGALALDLAHASADAL